MFHVGALLAGQAHPEHLHSDGIAGVWDILTLNASAGEEHLAIWTNDPSELQERLSVCHHGHGAAGVPNLTVFVNLLDDLHELNILSLFHIVGVHDQFSELEHVEVLEDSLAAADVGLALLGALPHGQADLVAVRELEVNNLLPA